MRRAFVRAACAAALLTGLFGCGDSSSVSACFGDPVFCNNVFQPVADAGASQTAASGDTVVLDGSASRSNGGSLKSFSWTQTGGPQVTLAGANTVRATFVAPDVTVDTQLSFRLTVVNTGDRADSDSTNVLVQPRPAAATAVALALFAGALLPAGVEAPADGNACGSATADLAPDVAAAQRGLWLAARTLALAKGLDSGESGAFLDAGRVLVAQNPVPRGDVAGEVESLGFSLLASFAADADPALHAAIAARQRDAAVPADPAALIGGRADVAADASNGVAIAAANDPEAADRRAVAELLALRAQCVDTTQALSATDAGFRVIAAAKPAGR